MDKSKTNCAIVKDLLPSYIDGLASPETSAFVEEHIKNCPACREAYEAMRAEPAAPAPKAGKPAKDPALAYLRKVKRRHALTVLAVALAVLVAVSMLAVVVCRQAFIKTYQLGAGQTQGVQVYSLENGSLYFCLTAKPKYAIASSNVQYATGQNGGTQMELELGYTWLGYLLPNHLGPETYFLANPAEVDTVVLAGATPEKSLVLWQAGDDVPKATPEIEDLARNIEYGPTWLGTGNTTAAQAG